MSKFIFCYWAPRGLSEPARMLLEYCGIDYENKIIKDRKEWDAEKNELGLEFPNLPYIIDGGVKLTESWAIFKYIARKRGLVASTDKEERDCDMLQGVIQDIRSSFTLTCYNPDFYALKDKMLEKQLVKLDMLKKYLSTKKFLFGDKLSYLDFVLYETLDHHRILSPSFLDKHPNILEYMKRFETLDQISAYFSSNRYHKFPINGDIAVWGGKSYNDLKN